MVVEAADSGGGSSRIISSSVVVMLYTESIFSDLLYRASQEAVKDS